MRFCFSSQSINQRFMLNKPEKATKALSLIDDKISYRLKINWKRKFDYVVVLDWFTN